ncbi:MAG: molybdopterin dinucleotide binding domain-containing protein [Promethearchaeota archaeon]
MNKDKPEPKSSLELILITGRTWHQGAAMEGPGKISEEYKKETAVCELDPKDMARLGVEEGQTVQLSTANGTSVVLWVRSGVGPQEGIAFVPLGMWANCLIGSQTHSTGMPSFKGIAVTIEPVKDGKVLNIKELIGSVL